MPTFENQNSKSHIERDLPHIIDLFKAPTERSHKRRLKREVKQLLRNHETTLSEAITCYDRSIEQLEQELKTSSPQS